MKRKKGRYQHNDKKTVNREYMSYEDVPIKDYDSNEIVSKNLTKKFLKVFLILFISVAALLALMNIEYLTPENISHWFQYDLLGKSEGNGYPVRFSGTNISTNNFELMDGVPVYCSDTSIVVLNSNAGEYQNRQHAFASPVLKTNSGYSIVYNIGATGYKIINRTDMVYSDSTKQKIFSADICSNGVYALLTSGDDYLAKLSVYRSDNLEKYAYSFADYYVNNVSLNKYGNRAVVSGVSSKNGGLTSVIYILDFSKKNYLQKYEIDDSYIYDVCYLNNGNAIAVGENSLYYINVDKNSKSDISYENKVLTTYTLDRDFGLLISLSKNPDGRECDISRFDSDGKMDIKFSTGTKISSLDFYDNKIASLSQSNINIYDNTGKSISSIETNADTRKICFINSNTMYILGKNEISVMNIDYTVSDK